MDKYFITKFYRYIPQIEGMTNITGVDNLNIIKASSDSVLEQLAAHPDQISFMEITELEATQATKFYGETRGYRKAYSDSEGLEPDADELANGKRKTKVYITPELEAATISLMKKAFHFQIDEEMACRQLGEHDINGNPRPSNGPRLSKNNLLRSHPFACYEGAPSEHSTRSRRLCLLLVVGTCVFWTRSYIVDGSL